MKQKKQLIEREKRKWSVYMERERKKRASKLIQKGALLEKYFDCDHLDITETENLLHMFSQYVNDNKLDKHKKDD